MRQTVMRETTVATRVGPLRVRQAGGGGPTVLLVHGLLLDGRLWDGVVDALPRDVRVVVPDLPLGAHRRPVPDRSVLTPEHVAGALLDVLDGVDASTAVLVGNDTGGALVQMAAAQAPDRVAGLVLAGCDAFEHFPPPLLRPLPRAVRLPGAGRALLGVLGVPALLADPGRLNLFTTRGFGRPLVADLLRPARTDPAVRADVVSLIAGMRPGPLLASVPALQRLGVPAAVVWGRRDRVFPPRDAGRLAQVLGTEVTWLDDALTFVPWDRPDAVAGAVRTVAGAAVA
ncbi:MAG TPA: alpha/beta fold hydrolase [Geodermatophilus sp.]|nr:alpha/beta fold hydrolase [Geodermatophilus sp.]